MAKTSKGADVVNTWRMEEEVSIGHMAEMCGDEGGQLYQWLSGHRESVPLWLATEVSLYSSIPLPKIAGPNEELVHLVFAAMAQAAAARV